MGLPVRSCGPGRPSEGLGFTLNEMGCLQGWSREERELDFIFKGCLNVMRINRRVQEQNLENHLKRISQLSR